VGSRDLNACDNGYCSSVCCMYANKQAVIAKEHSDTELDTAIFFMDMRTFGKDFDKYANRAREDHGVRHIRSRIHSVFPDDGDRLRIVYATESGNNMEEQFDMVVLSVGLAPNPDAVSLARRLGVDLNHYHHAQTDCLTPVNTNREGDLRVRRLPGAQGHSPFGHGSLGLGGGRRQHARRRPLGADPQTGAATGTGRIRPGTTYRRLRLQLRHQHRRHRRCAGGPRLCGRSAPRGPRGGQPVHLQSQDSQDHMKAIIREKGINRVVVASCSPRTHEPLFQETIRDAGLNKYLFEMANIRDQNTWVHMNEPARATAKAKDLVRMAVAKAARIEPLHQVSLAITKAALVVGGGVAGMEAALGVADQGADVVLVEQSTELGGVANLLNATWQGEPVAPYLADTIERVKAHPGIRLFTGTRVKSTTGSIGNFSTTLVSVNGSQTQTVVDHGATILATGGSEYKPDLYLYGTHPDVLTHLDMDTAVATKDKRLLLARSVAFIQCVGSRDDKRPYCSKICCTHSLKSALAVKRMHPKKKVTILYRDIRSYGFREDLYKEAREAGILFIRYEPENPPRVATDADKGLMIDVTDHVLRMPVRLRPDLLVLATGVVPNANRELFEIFKVPVNADGFLVEAHAKLRPVEFSSEGIYLAGLAHYPKPLEESIAQAKAAAARAMTLLSREAIMVGGVVATVDSGKCAACLTCVRACPYDIPRVDDHSHAVIDPAECHGCGTCVAECPGKAITLAHFTDDQLIAKIEALFIAA
jgi:heterodisulfide reductase subunit A-like polyferredoxin